MPFFLTRQGCLVYCITVILMGLSQIGGLSCEIGDAESVSCSDTPAGMSGIQLNVNNAVVICFL